MKFEALEVGYELITSLRDPVRKIRACDRKLCQQIRTAADSVTLNISEANRRTGRDRLHLFRIAAGSAAEVRAGLRNALSWGDISAEQTKLPLELIDRVLAMLWRLTH